MQVLSCTPLFHSSAVLCFPACLLSDTPVLPVLSQVSSWMQEKVNNTNIVFFWISELMPLVIQFCDHGTGQERKKELIFSSILQVDHAADSEKVLCVCVTAEN